jgi:hypothetical protein
MSNLITSTILKQSRSKVLGGGMTFSPAQPMGWDCLIVGLLLLLGVFDCWDIFS